MILLEFEVAATTERFNSAFNTFIELIESPRYQDYAELAKLMLWTNHSIMWDAFGWGTFYLSHSDWPAGYDHYIPSSDGGGAISGRLEFIDYFISHELLDDGDPCIAYKAYHGRSRATYLCYSKPEYEAELLNQEKVQASIKTLLDKKKKQGQLDIDAYIKETDKVLHFKPFICVSAELTQNRCCTLDSVIQTIKFHIQEDLESYNRYLKYDKKSMIVSERRDFSDPILYDKPDPATIVVRKWMLENNLKPSCI